MLQLRKSIFVIGGMVSLYTVLAVGQQPLVLNPKASDEAVVLMRAKLSSSQKVVEGLMSGDFEMIRKGGEDLQRICNSEHWKRGDDQVIGHYRGELNRSAIKLMEQAKAENMDGVAYTYMHTMTTCISCHEYSRHVLRVAKRGDAGGVVPIPVTEQESSAFQYRLIHR